MTLCCRVCRGRTLAADTQITKATDGECQPEAHTQRFDA